MLHWPLSATSKPHKIRITVVLPAPSGPIKPNNSPELISSEILSTAVIDSYDFVSDCMVIAFGFIIFS